MRLLSFPINCPHSHSLESLGICVVLGAGAENVWGELNRVMSWHDDGRHVADMNLDIGRPLLVLPVLGNAVTTINLHRLS